MKNRMKVAFILVLLILTSSLLSAQSLRLLEEKTFTVKANQTLKVDAVVADVLVETWDKNEVEIKIYGNKKAQKNLEISMDEYSRGVKVKIEKEGFQLFTFFNNINAKIEAKVPKNFTLDIETSGGDIAAYEVTGDIDLETSGGDIILEGNTGELRVNTSGGAIRLRDHNGLSDLSTSGGDIEVRGHRGDLEAGTSGGDIDLDVIDGEINGSTSGGDIICILSGKNKGIRLSTSGGSIKVKVPSETEAKVHLYTSGGDCKLRFDEADLSKDKDHEIKGKLNGGGELISCSTSGGDVTLVEK